MTTQTKQATRNGGTQAPITALSCITLMMAFSSASGLTIQKPRAVFPGTGIGESTNSNVQFTQQIRAKSPPTKLLYAHSDFEDDDHRRDEHHAAVHELRTRVTDWWSTMFAPAVEVDTEDAEQQNVDEYLEFLDRRYHRLHDEEDQKMTPNKPTKTFAALDWLMDTSHKDATYDPQQSHEDALFVLGVAALASDRLLQKHHIPVKAVATQTVIDTMAYAIPMSATRSQLFGDVTKPASSILQQARAHISKAASSILRQARARRRALVIYQERQVKRAVVASILVVLKAPSKVADTAEALWKHAGGKKTIALTLTMFTACFVLLRPVAEAVVGVVFESVFAES